MFTSYSIFPTLSRLRWRTTTCLFTMLSIPPSDSTPANTFSFKSAPRPRTIPLYATSIPRRSSHQLSIHQTLPSRARYQPCAQRTPPIDISSTSSGDSPLPDSPLTSIEPTAPSGSSREVLPIQIPPPSTEVTVANAGWHAELVPRYRRIARTVIDTHLNISLALSEQDPEALRAARDKIENQIKGFSDHEDHWGANTLLRDQLKSVKDTCRRKKGRRLEISGLEFVILAYNTVLLVQLVAQAIPDNI